MEEVISKKLHALTTVTTAFTAENFTTASLDVVVLLLAMNRLADMRQLRRPSCDHVLTDWIGTRLIIVFSSSSFPLFAY